ncbi:MAG: hypothetical protein HF981_19580 [Desulfobacteraceae bacterium]|nr:hypothetical protein [Desulfobacteraceae bacterium]MBC2752603.1 hypothetical protein [Desulfobacteraceae bacterium]
MKHLKPLTLSIVLLVMVPCVGVGQDSFNRIKISDEDMERNEEVWNSYQTIFPVLEERFGGGWRVAELLKVCGYNTLAKGIDPHFSKILAVIASEVENSKDLKYKDGRAIMETQQFIRIVAAGYKTGLNHALQLTKEYFPANVCEQAAKEADKLIQEKQNKQQQ